MSMDLAQKARLESALNKRFRWSDGSISTLGERLAVLNLVEKTIYREVYGSKRVHLEYQKRTAPKLSYTLWYHDAQGKLTGMDVPKLVYDTFNLPERKTGDWSE